MGIDQSKYIFNKAEADDAIEWIETYCKHTSAQHAGKIFTLMPWQRDLISKLFGTYRQNGERRYRYCYIEGPKSLGKSPLLAAIGLYILLKQKGDPNPLIISCAANSEQAKVVFLTAKDMINANKALFDRAEPMQHEIRATKRDGRWIKTSGKGKGKSGFAPSLVVVDELHEITANDTSLMELLEANLMKRNNSVMIIATNTGFDMNSPWGTWHQRAKRVIDGISEEDNVLAYMFNVPYDSDIGSPETWKKANPSIGTTTTLEKYEAEYKKTKANPSGELSFRRLYLGQIVASERGWLQPRDIAGCIADELPPNLAEYPLYIGLDVGEVDDITAVQYTWVSPDGDIYCRIDQWLPKEAAYKYRDSYGIPYIDWESKGYINLVAGRTITPETHQAIVDSILTNIAGQQLVMVCYDRAKADNIVFALLKAGIKCEPIANTYNVTGQATKGLETKIIEGSIHFLRNDCLLWQLEQAVIKPGMQGDITLVKATSDSKKNDGVMATIYALTRGMSHFYRPEEETEISKWDGSISFV